MRGRRAAREARESRRATWRRRVIVATAVPLLAALLTGGLAVLVVRGEVRADAERTDGNPDEAAVVTSWADVGHPDAPAGADDVGLAQDCAPVAYRLTIDDPARPVPEGGVHVVACAGTYVVGDAAVVRRDARDGFSWRAHDTQTLRLGPMTTQRQLRLLVTFGLPAGGLAAVLTGSWLLTALSYERQERRERERLLRDIEQLKAEGRWLAALERADREAADRRRATGLPARPGGPSGSPPG